MREQAKTPESSFQRAYLRQKKREREQVRVFRALLLVSFLVLWEVAADLRWIDPFIFCAGGKNVRDPADGAEPSAPYRDHGV